MGNRVDLFGHDWNTDEGFGDTVSRVIKKVSKGKLNECGGCKKRRETLNRMIPYGRDVETRNR